MPEPIKSYWRQETGRWNEEDCKYINREYSEWKEKEIQMEIDTSRDKPVLHFIGGPTGFESYYVEDLIDNLRIHHPQLSICGGTINRWPECFVYRKDVISFLQKRGLI